MLAGVAPVPTVLLVIASDDGWSARPGPAMWLSSTRSA